LGATVALSISAASDIKQNRGINIPKLGIFEHKNALLALIIDLKYP
jgi:hypothetical protein